ncbi:hypothetical protein [Fictibacillus gelatini]|uniref:hypothetical protein n=1 Tax=Fictibacillus gelatini TaxID=225985 RepID=UPI0012B555C7|nr:hypothetical protein [Fictibacillus gelatini]
MESVWLATIGKVVEAIGVSEQILTTDFSRATNGGNGRLDPDIWHSVRGHRRYRSMKRGASADPDLFCAVNLENELLYRPPLDEGCL